MSVSTSKKFTFTWEIENFNVYLLKHGEVLKSPAFVINALKGTSWYLYLLNKNDKNYMSGYLKRTDCLKEDVSISFSLDIINKESDDWNDGELYDEISIFSQENNTWGYPELYEIDKLEKITSSLTIQCKIAFSESENLSCKVRTKIAVKLSSFRWNVAELETSSWEVSKIFPVTSSADIEIVLTAPEDMIHICINKIDKENPTLYYVSCKLSLIDLKEVEYDSMKSEHVFDGDNERNNWQFPSFLSKSKLQSEKSKYVSNGFFTIICEFCISDGESFDFIEEYDNKLTRVHSGIEEDTFTILQQDLRLMYTKQLKSDVDLRVGNRTFPAHKSLLSARSPVFAVMFEQDMLENKTGVVDITDVDPDTLNLFLEFLYTGSLNDVDYESASKLLILADKYQVSSLLKKCSSIMMSNLTTANVCNAVMVANMIGEKALKVYSMDYIAAHASVIFISEDWSQCIKNDIKLATDILNNLSINVGAKCK